jgi:hypothetical protein
MESMDWQMLMPDHGGRKASLRPIPITCSISITIGALFHVPRHNPS